MAKRSLSSRPTYAPAAGVQVAPTPGQDSTASCRLRLHTPFPAERRNKRRLVPPRRAAASVAGERVGAPDEAHTSPATPPVSIEAAAPGLSARLIVAIAGRAGASVAPKICVPFDENRRSRPTSSDCSSAQGIQQSSSQTPRSLGRWSARAMRRTSEAPGLSRSVTPRDTHRSRSSRARARDGLMSECLASGFVTSGTQTVASAMLAERRRCVANVPS